MNFSTPKFNAAVTQFKAFCPGHEELFRFGQFYVTKRTTNALIAQVEAELRSNTRFLFLAPDQLENTIKFFRTKLSKKIDDISVPEITAMLDLIEVGGDMALIRAMFALSPADAVHAQEDFTALWSRPDIAGSPLFSQSSPTFGKAKAAFKLELDKCFQVLRAFARQLLKKRGIANLPQALAISDGAIGGAFLKETALAAGTNVGQQTVKYRSPAALGTVMTRMKAAIDAGAFVHCGVSSGARHEHSKFPQPEHHILVFAHDTLSGQDAFLFWDPDASHSNIASTPWGNGFGVLFGTAGHLSTAFDDGDLLAIERDGTKTATFGDHLNDPLRHCYQVYSVQTLPLPATVRIHAKLLDLPSRSTYDQMLHNAVMVYAAHGVEIIEESREILTSLDDADIDRLHTVFVGDARIGEPTADVTELHDRLRSRGRDFGVDPAPNDVVIAVVHNLVPANRGSSSHPPEKPGALLSASLAGEWTLAHEIGHLLGLDHVADADHLMLVSTNAFADAFPRLTDDEIAAILESPLART